MSNILNQKELKALRYIRDFLKHTGKSPSVRKIMNELEYKSPNSAAIIIDSLIKYGYIKKENGDIKLIRNPEQSINHAQTIKVPLVGSAPCGAPFLAEQNIEMEIPISTEIARPPHKYFLLRAIGDSMNNGGIDDGDLVLVKQQQGADENDIIVALIDDEATIKKFHFTPGAIVLKPVSKNKEHKPIVLTEDFQIQGKVVKSFPAPGI